MKDDDVEVAHRAAAREALIHSLSRPRRIYPFRTVKERVVIDDALRWSYLLEVFELGVQVSWDRPSAKRHAVWLRDLRSNDWRWECSCGARVTDHVLDARFFATARRHFEQPWDPAAVPVWHPAAVWNDRAAGRTTPDAEALATLAEDLIRTRGSSR